MAHPEQLAFIERIKNIFPNHFGGRIVEMGSLDVNGNLNYLYESEEVTRVDLAKGKNIDIVMPIHEYKAPGQGSIDLIISSEVFEHDPYFGKSLENIIWLLRSGGLFVFTCATTGRPIHGVRDVAPDDSPFTLDFYKNRTEQDFKLHPSWDLVERSFFQNGRGLRDLYGWAIKK